MGALMRILLRIARAVLQSVIGQITQQLNVVENQVQARLKSYVQEVLGGVWTGQGADRFVETVNSDVMNMLNGITEQVTNTRNSITQALDIMDQADQQVRSLVENLIDVFQSI